ncbi:MAG: hypothetical protein GY888_17605, partial [Planctomycetaceae bacterium]|nr:hypothetical protein [Planctomycetaceae bacterium]
IETLYLGTSIDPEADTDGDGILDIHETNTGIFVNADNTGTNPFLADTDGDGFSDGEELAGGGDPNDAESLPFHLDPASASADPLGETLTFEVTAPAGTLWIAESLANWISITGNATGTGPGTVTYTANRNSSVEEREGQIRIKPHPSALTNGLVAYYPFNGNANDESGNGNNGTVNGASLVTDRGGRTNSAYSFDGTDDFIEIADSPELNFAESMSISFWLKPDSWGERADDTPGIISKMLDNNSEGYVIYHDGNYKEKLNFRSVGDDYNVTGSKAVSGQWDHWTVSCDAGRVTWYRNGTEDAAYNDVNTDLSNSASLFLGYTERWRSWGFPAYFSGAMDDVRIYNRALSEEEVTAVYNLEEQKPTPPGLEIAIYVESDLGEPLSVDATPISG